MSSCQCVMLQAWCSHGQVEPAVLQLWWSEFPVHERQMRLMQMMPTFHGHGRARIVVSWYLPNSLMLNSSDQAATVPGKRKLHCTMQVRNLHLPECKFPTRAVPKNGIIWNDSGGKKILHPAEAERKKADGQICLMKIVGFVVQGGWVYCHGFSWGWSTVKSNEFQLRSIYYWGATVEVALALPAWWTTTLNVYLYQALDKFAWIYHQ